jgi:hypothetical protein
MISPFLLFSGHGGRIGGYWSGAETQLSALEYAYLLHRGSEPSCYFLLSLRARHAASGTALVRDVLVFGHYLHSCGDLHLERLPSLRATLGNPSRHQFLPSFSFVQLGAGHVWFHC